MQVLCAWCKKLVAEHEQRSQTDCPVSHGICERCAELFEQFEPVQVGQMLDRFDGPVLWIDSRGRAVTGNSAASELLGKEPAEICGLLGGEVIECVYSQQQGGCGKTMHCTGCTIRRTVMETFETGRSRWGVEAYQHIYTSKGVERVRVLITTERWRGRVLLRIDAMESVADE